MLVIDANSAAIERIADSLQANPAQIEQAITSTLRKMRGRIETKIKKVAAQKLRIPQKAMGDRFFTTAINPGDDELKVWIGTWDISPFSLGAVTQYGLPGISGGVRAGRRSYPGAFLAKVYSGQTKVWIRLHSKHYSPELYPTKYRPGDRGLGDLRGRFPVVRAAVPIDAVIREVLEREGDDIAKDFETVFARELNYFVVVKGNA